MKIKNLIQQNDMDGHTDVFESLFEKAVDYGKTSFRLVKLKTLSKTSDVVATTFSHLVVLIFTFSFFLFMSLGLALWISDILGKSFYGFLIVGAIYGFIGLFIGLFMRKWLKRILSDYIVDQVLK